VLVIAGVAAKRREAVGFLRTAQPDVFRHLVAANGQPDFLRRRQQGGFHLDDHIVERREHPPCRILLHQAMFDQPVLIRLAPKIRSPDEAKAESGKHATPLPGFRLRFIRATCLVPASPA